MEIKSNTITLLTGMLLVPGFFLLTGSRTSSLEFPIATAGVGFLFMGIRHGMSGRSRSLNSIFAITAFTSLVFFYLIPRSHLYCFSGMPRNIIETNLMLLCINGFILSSTGKWTGEKFLEFFMEREDTGNENESLPVWQVVIPSSILGFMIAILLLAIILQFFNPSLKILLLVLMIGAAVTGYAAGRMSEVNMPNNSIASGLLISILWLDFYKLTLDTGTLSLNIQVIFLFLSSGLIAAFVGALNGRKKKIKINESV